MLIMSSVADLVQVALSTAGPVDVHASWVDVNNAGAITPGRLNTLLNAAGLANVVVSPPATTQRNVKTLHVRNKNASIATQVIVTHYDGANAVVMFNAILNAGRALQYTDQGGFRML